MTVTRDFNWKVLRAPLGGLWGQPVTDVSGFFSGDAAMLPAVFFGGANPDPSQLDGLIFQISPETLVCFCWGASAPKNSECCGRELGTTHGHVSTFTNCGWLHLSVPTLLTATFCPSTWRPLLKIGETWVNE